MPGSAIFLAIECLLLAILVFGDVGFDRPGRYGLDFGDAILLVALYSGALICGVTYAVRRKQWRIAALQLAIPFVVYFVINVVPRMREPLHAADYQHLVGKSRAEVRESLGGRRSRTSGAMSGSEGEREFENYDGMSIYYSKDGRVLSVESR